MAMYQLLVGDLPGWLHGVFLSGMSMTDMSFFFGYTYAGLFKDTMIGAFAGAVPVAAAYLFYYGLFYFLPLIVGTVFVYRAHQKQVVSFHPVVYIIAFFGLVSFYYQVPFYLSISYPLYLVALLTLIRPNQRLGRVVLICLVSLFVLQGVLMTMPGVSQLAHPERYVYSAIPKISLYVQEDVHKEFIDVLAFIDGLSQPGDAMFVFPFDPEFHFVTERVNPFPHIGTSFTITSDEKLTALEAALVADPPSLIVHNTAHSYNSDFDRTLHDRLVDGSLGFTEVAAMHDYTFFVPGTTSISVAQ